MYSAHNWYKNYSGLSIPSVPLSFLFPDEDQMTTLSQEYKDLEYEEEANRIWKDHLDSDNIFQGLIFDFEDLEIGNDTHIYRNNEPIFDFSKVKPDLLTDENIMYQEDYPFVKE